MQVHTPLVLISFVLFITLVKETEQSSLGNLLGVEPKGDVELNRGACDVRFEGAGITAVVNITKNFNCTKKGFQIQVQNFDGYLPVTFSMEFTQFSQGVQVQLTTANNDVIWNSAKAKKVQGLSFIRLTPINLSSWNDDDIIQIVFVSSTFGSWAYVILRSVLAIAFILVPALIVFTLFHRRQMGMRRSAVEEANRNFSVAVIHIDDLNDTPPPTYEDIYDTKNPPPCFCQAIEASGSQLPEGFSCPCKRNKRQSVRSSVVAGIPTAQVSEEIKEESSST